MSERDGALFCEQRSRVWAWRAIRLSDSHALFRRCVGLASRWHRMSVRCAEGDAAALRLARQCV